MLLFLSDREHQILFQGLLLLDPVLLKLGALMMVVSSLSASIKKRSFRNHLKFVYYRNRKCQIDFLSEIRNGPTEFHYENRKLVREWFECLMDSLER